MIEVFTEADTAKVIQAALEGVSKRYGEPYAAFVDHNWTCGPAGSVDLFQAYSDRFGSIGMISGILPFRGIPIGMFLIPKSRIESFTAYLDALIIDMPDGGMVTPVCIRPKEVTREQIIDPAAIVLFDNCYVICSQSYAPDDSAVITKRQASKAHWN